MWEKMKKENKDRAKFATCIDNKGSDPKQYPYVYYDGSNRQNVSDFVFGDAIINSYEGDSISITTYNNSRVSLYPDNYLVFDPSNNEFIVFDKDGFVLNFTDG